MGRLSLFAIRPDPEHSGGAIRFSTFAAGALGVECGELRVESGSKISLRLLISRALAPLRDIWE